MKSVGGCAGEEGRFLEEASLEIILPRDVPR